MNNDCYFIYAIVSLVNNHIYVGMSKNIINRVKEHNAGKVFSTKPFIPWMIFFSQSAGSALSARKLEKYYKCAAGKRKLRSILKTFLSGSLPD